MTLATPTMLLPVPVATLYGIEHPFVRMWVAAAAGALIVLVTSKLICKESPAASRIGLDSAMLWAASIAYVASWFLPVIDGGWTLADGIPGWEAARAVMGPLWEPQAFVERPGFALLGVATGLTNLLMIVALAQLHWSRLSSANRWKRWAVLATAINASWIGLDWWEHDFRIGYYLWLLSFVLLALAVLARGAGGQHSGAVGVGIGRQRGGENSSALASP